MATLQELRDERLRKLNDLKDLGVDPYPAKANRTHHIHEVTGQFDQIENKTVTIVGRITGIRKFGKIAFVVLKDASGSVQLFLRGDTLEKTDPANNRIGLEHLSLLDSGDFIEATGPVIKTQTREI